MKVKPKGLRAPVWHVSFLYDDGTVGWLVFEGVATALDKRLKAWEPTGGYPWPVAISLIRAR